MKRLLAFLLSILATANIIAPASAHFDPRPLEYGVAVVNETEKDRKFLTLLPFRDGVCYLSTIKIEGDHREGIEYGVRRVQESWQLFAEISTNARLRFAMIVVRVTATCMCNQDSSHERCLN